LNDSQELRGIPVTVLDQIANMVRSALEEAGQRGLLPATSAEDLSIERPQDPARGDFASPLPLKLARTMRTDPMRIAETLVSVMSAEGAVGKVSAARPGFINFTLKAEWLAEQVDVIREAGDAYGDLELGAGQRVQVEFVSVNPTGPLHVGHARGAVFGSTLAEILAAAGYEVEREYYFNDAGSQMDRFNQSLYARYLQQSGRDAQLPADGYQGEYMVELAREIAEEAGDKYLSMPEEDAVAEIGEVGVKRMIDVARADMRDLRVSYDNWFSESSLYAGGQYDLAMKLLRDSGYLVDRDGATWFKSTAFGDDEDKVFVRSTGAPTYFATDVAYHYNKFLERRFDRVINVLGADHQGHVRFMKAVPAALGVAAERLDLIIYQLVTLRRGDETVRFSKRTGDLITLRELVEEVGADACRYFFLARSPESQMEFDLELAKEQSSDNPAYYVQYAHARICGILRLAEQRGIDYEDGDLSLISHEAELALIRKMLALPELIEMMARSLQPHHLPHYAAELATAFHLFYERCRVVSSDPEELPVSMARLKLVHAARTVLARCLRLMIMETPEEM
jgi:arginyl-tRNA synthetase